MAVKARLDRVERVLSRSGALAGKRLITEDEFEACVRRLDRSCEIRRLRKGMDYTESDLRRGAEKMLRGNQDFGGFAFELNKIGLEVTEIDSSSGGLNGSASRNHF